jgi:antirestriction protein ArdC
MTNITATSPTSNEWDSAEHPRGHADNAGGFSDKLQTAPEVSLADGETVFTKKYDTVGDKVKAFYGELETQVEDLAGDENWNNYLNTMSSFHTYSMTNQMLIAAQNPEATRVAGFNKWKELERSVKKGEKGISILAPAMAKVDEKDSDGAVVVGPDGKPSKVRRVIGFTTATVFDVSQTEGKPLPSIDRTLTEEPPAGFIDDLEQSIRDAGFTVTYEEMPGSKMGFTSPDGRVVIDKSLAPADRARVLAHERGHIAMGHLDRLDEYHQGHNGHRGAMEVEAESFAYVVCRSNGMSPAVGDSSSTYVAGWSQSDPTQIKKSAEAVAKGVKTVLTSDVFVSRETARLDEAAAAA